MNDTLSERSLFHPSTRTYRFIILAFVALIPFGSYFAYDIVGAIAPTLVEELGAGRGIVGAFYTSYSVASIISVLIGGILTDRWGTRKASIIFSILVCIGAAMVAFFPKNLIVILLGRFIFGAASEPLIVAIDVMLTRWFKGKELALSFGISLSVMRLGTVFAFNTGELISAHYGHYRYALIAALLFCLFSLVMNVIYNLLDKRGERILKKKDGHAGDKIVFGDVRKFKPSFWFVTMLCVTFYSAIFPFTALSTDLFADKWGIPRVAEASGSFISKVFNNFLHMFSTAGGITSIIIFASLICAPFAGLLVDKFGKRASVMIIGSLILIFGHLTLGLTKTYPAYPMAALGVAFVLVPAAMWPSIPLVVRKERTGTAFGLMTMIQAIGLALFPYLNGLLRDTTKTYTASILMFASLGIFGLVFALFLKWSDKKEGNVLERP